MVRVGESGCRICKGWVQFESPLKIAYRLLLRAKLNTTQALEEMKKTLGGSADVQELIQFIESAERGIVK